MSDFLAVDGYFIKMHSCGFVSDCSSSSKQLNRKDELYNDLVDDFVQRDLTFHKSTVEDEGSYILQVQFSEI